MGVFNLTVRPGLTFNSLKSGPADYGSVPSFRIGFEIEKVLPFSKGLWAVTFEPAYQSYSSTRGIISIDYKSIDLGINFRRYFFSGESGKFYVNAGFVYGIPLAVDQSFKVWGTVGSIVTSGANVEVGAGYVMKRLSAELNYAFGRDILTTISESSYGGPSLIVGYRLSK